MTPYWSPERHADRRGFLHARARIVAAIRAWFAREGFIEVEPNLIVPSPGAEVHLQAVAAGGGYLHTSPEFAMKKLLAAGEEKIFYLGKVWRAGEQGPLHASEFTMLEWYRADAPYERVMEDCMALARVASEVVGASVWRRDGREVDPFADPLRWETNNAFRYFAGVDILETLDSSGAPDRDALARKIESNPDFLDRTNPIRVAPGDSWSDLFSKLLVTDVEPQLGWGALTFLDNYPAPEAALARRKANNPRVAERFELYAFGIELANGFGELTDPVEQRARLEAAMAEKEKTYGSRWPIDEDFLAAVAHMPPASGVALGLDRLVMLASGARMIQDVLWTPLE
ncbi:MAG: EF-P lysine aminoacylase EpmA [Pseudomonadota bacterium]